MAESEGGTRQGALWGARFASTPADALREISVSPDYYFRLLGDDVQGCRAHCRELERVGLLTATEAADILRHLDEIERDWNSGSLARDPRAEDVHGFIEQELVRRAGEVGGKLRAGRSRNDQTANDLRLFMRRESRLIAEEIRELAGALIDQAEQHVESVCPGFTHLQIAQPVTFGHQLLAHVHPLLRDLDRLRAWDARHATSPLGAAALAGSGITGDTDAMARDLGYERSFDNSIDAVGARDHVSEFVFILTQLLTNLSRFAEEQILWSSQQFAWIALDDSWSTGSSIMPQKKNPDIAELTRGKAGTMLGILTGTIAIQKGLPLAYNRDLFEDKYAVLHAVDAVNQVLPALAGSVRTMRVDVDRMRQQSTWGFALATDVADELSRRGVPFRESHEIVGALVRLCETRGIQLADVDPETLGRVDARLSHEFITSLGPEQSLALRAAKGSARPDRVREQIAAARAALEASRSSTSAESAPRGRNTVEVSDEH
jgi:argininosuccinate lyase